MCSIPFANRRFKKIWAEDYAAETFYISNFKSNNEYVVRLFKLVFLIILVFLDALRTSNYSSGELLIKSCKFRQVNTTITSTSIGLISL